MGMEAMKLGCSDMNFKPDDFKLIWISSLKQILTPQKYNTVVDDIAYGIEQCIKEVRGLVIKKDNPRIEIQYWMTSIDFFQGVVNLMLVDAAYADSESLSRMLWNHKQVKSHIKAIVRRVVYDKSLRCRDAITGIPEEALENLL